MPGLITYCMPITSKYRVMVELTLLVEPLIAFKLIVFVKLPFDLDWAFSETIKTQKSHAMKILLKITLLSQLIWTKS